MNAPSPSPAAERMRRSRELRRQGLRIIPIVLRDTEVDALIQWRLLEAGERDDPAAVGTAVGLLLDRLPPARWQRAMGE